MFLSSSPPTAVIRGVEELSLSLTSISNTWALVIHYALITDRVASAGPCHELRESQLKVQSAGR